MKTKILILIVEKYRQESMLTHELKELAEKYEVLFADSIVDALTKIARAKLLEEYPINGLVFQRNTLVVNQTKCWVVHRLAEDYSNISLTAINMIRNDQDSAKNYAVSANYCKENNWKQVKAIFDDNIKD
jgi:hypothetical protein